MQLLRSRDRDTYTFLVNQLIDARANFIEMSYSQMIISSNMNEEAVHVMVTLKHFSQVLSWIQQNLVNEANILKCSALSSGKILEVLNVVFGDRLPQRIMFRVQ